MLSVPGFARLELHDPSVNTHRTYTALENTISDTIPVR